MNVVCWAMVVERENVQVGDVAVVPWIAHPNAKPVLPPPVGEI